MDNTQNHGASAHELPPPPPHARKIELPDIDFEHISLDFSQYQDKWKLSADGTYYELRFVYYVTNVVSPQHQYMNIFTPAAYLNADGTVNPTGVCGRYTAQTAPVVFYNECSGWMSSVPGDVRPSYLQEGFVHVYTGVRSRGLPNGVGKAPFPCIDQKAAIRMLRLNHEYIPGNMNRIVSCGTSGGGQMSSILGATGNMDVYFPWLYEAGAAGITKLENGSYVSTIRDDIFASQCFCPIADLNNADMAYAWWRFDDPVKSASIMFSRDTKPFTAFQLALQDDLAVKYGEYLNDLKLLDKDGTWLCFDRNSDGVVNLRSGSYYKKILTNISVALNAFLKDKLQPDGSIQFTEDHGPWEKEHHSYPNVYAYIHSLPNWESWLEEQDGTFYVTDLAGFCRGIGLSREKTVPGFDTFHLTAENDAFGTAVEPAVHFSRVIGDTLLEHLERYGTLDGFQECDSDRYIEDTRREDIAHQTYLMNATHILLDCANGNLHTDISKHWRTRNGCADSHTSFTIAYNLCLAAQMAGADVDYSLIWNANHGEVDGDGTGTFEEWVHSICAESTT